MKLRYLKIGFDKGVLYNGFEINFRKGELVYIDEPICFVGLNGSGKSVTLQILAEIFCYLEMLSLLNVDDIIEKKEFERIESVYELWNFQIEYEISTLKWAEIFDKIDEEYKFKIIKDSISNSDESVQNEIISSILSQKSTVTITKENGELSCVAKTFDFPFIFEIEQRLWNKVLPNNIIGYSSGENELLSKPFIKLYYSYFDQFIKKSNAENTNQLVKNRLIYLDYEANDMLVISNLIMDYDLNRELETEIKRAVGIFGLYSFTIHIKLNYNFPSHITFGIQQLKECATFYYEVGKGKNKTLTMEFLIDDEVKRAFRAKFRISLNLFYLFYSLRIMNIHLQSPSLRSKILNSNDDKNLADLIPRPPSGELIFDISNVTLRKDNAHKIPYSDLSDGEHQLLLTLGTVNLFQEYDTLFIFDEPETHFNPQWRANLVSLLMKNINIKERFQDIFLTTHSPFIVSDCRAENVYIFEKIYNQIFYETAVMKGINTYGGSVNILTTKLFNCNDAISQKALDDMKLYIDRKKNGEETEKLIDEINIEFGDSIEKLFLIKEIKRI